MDAPVALAIIANKAFTLYQTLHQTLDMRYFSYFLCQHYLGIGILILKRRKLGQEKLRINPKSQLVDSEGSSNLLSFIINVVLRALLKTYIECINHQLIPLEVKKD